MRVLLDECVDPRVAMAFPNHDVRTVSAMGWNRLQNGELLALAAKDFDIFVTIDKGIEYQQNLSKFSLGIVVVTVPKNKITYYRPLFTAMLAAVETVRPGQVVHIPSRTGPE